RLPRADRTRWRLISRLFPPRGAALARRTFGLRPGRGSVRADRLHVHRERPLLERPGLFLQGGIVRPQGDLDEAINDLLSAEIILAGLADGALLPLCR